MMLLVFQAGESRYGLDVKQVVEVIPRIEIRPIPGMPEYVAGLINYRGKVIPVVDLSVLLTGIPCRVLLSTRIILVEYGRGVSSNILGLVTEQATDILQFEEGELQTPGVWSDEVPCLGPLVVNSERLVQRIEVEPILPESLRRRLFEQQSEAS